MLFRTEIGDGKIVAHEDLPCDAYNLNTQTRNYEIFFYDSHDITLE